MDLTEEVSAAGGYQSRTQSLRDKMKKRRQAIESLMTGELGGTEGASSEATALKRTKSDSSVAEESLSGLSGAQESGPDHREEETPPQPADDLSALLSLQSAKEREERSQQDEIFSLLSQPTAREQSLLNTFKSVDGGGVKEFCQHSTKTECCKVNKCRQSCEKLHFVKIIQKHTDETLGDCSFLNTCFHMDTCKYIHYEVDKSDIESKVKKGSSYRASIQMLESTKLVPPQWIQCDLRNFKFDVLGKFSVLMADPPWDIHMELPYGTMADDEMRKLPVPSMQVGEREVDYLTTKL